MTDLSSYMMPRTAIGTAPSGTQTGNPFDTFYTVGPAFCGLDARAFIMPTFRQHKGVYSESSLELLRQKGPLNFEQIEQAIGRGVISNLAGVSISTHRDKFPVQTLGRMNPAGFVGSRRTVAGSLLFWLGDISPLTGLLAPAYQNKLYFADELPPFDLYLTFMNDQGHWASCVVQGITILDEGTVIEQAMAEGIVITYSYMAMSSTPITPGYFSMLSQEARDVIINTNIHVSTSTYEPSAAREGGRSQTMTDRMIVDAAKDRVRR